MNLDLNLTRTYIAMYVRVTTMYVRAFTHTLLCMRNALGVYLLFFQYPRKT